MPCRLVTVSRERNAVSLFLAVCGTPLFYARPVFALRVLHPSELLTLLALWLVTDFFFFLAHGAMHGRGRSAASTTSTTARCRGRPATSTATASTQSTR